MVFHYYIITLTQKPREKGKILYIDIPFLKPDIYSNGHQRNPLTEEEFPFIITFYSH